MKFISTIVLVFFISFLATPTIVSVIKKGSDVSVLFSFDDEESQKDFKEIKADLTIKYDFTSVNYSIITFSKIISENLSRHDNVSEEIFSPPPEIV